MDPRTTEILKDMKRLSRQEDVQLAIRAALTNRGFTSLSEWAKSNHTEFALFHDGLLQMEEQLPDSKKADE